MAQTSPPPFSSFAALVVDDPTFDRHRPLAYHPERPERLAAARAALAKSRVRAVAVPTREATNDELARVHDAAYVEELAGLRGRQEFLDPDTYVAEGSVHAALSAAGALVDVVDRLIDGDVPRAVALLRPPGHHARPGQAMGFCLVNNVAVAAAHARARGVARVAVIDYDVHHGNGTQEIFYDDPSVLYVSTHQYPFYPGTGARNERGGGDGKGFTVNVPLAGGGGDAVYRAAFERIVLPVLEAYAPELILVSAGFDAALRDPLAEMRLTADAFGWMTRALAAQAAASAKGRIGLVLEGGYDLVALEAGLTRAIDALDPAAAAPSLADAAMDAPDVEAAAGSAARSWRVA